MEVHRLEPGLEAFTGLVQAAARAGEPAQAVKKIHYEQAICYIDILNNRSLPRSSRLRPTEVAEAWLHRAEASLDVDVVLLCFGKH